MNRTFQNLTLLIGLLLISALLVSACVPAGQADFYSYPVSVTKYFKVAYSNWGEVDPKDVLDGRVTLDFKTPTQRKIDKPRQDLWLKAQLPISALPQNSDALVLELPGHLFHRVDAWFKASDDQVFHQQTGRVVAYDDRPVKFADVAFNIPKAAMLNAGGEAVDLLIRMNVGVPVNFAALLWDQNSWQQNVMNERLWYGLFVGGILVLMVYNLFFALMLRQPSYLYYVGYILTLASCVIIYTPLPEEYIFRQGSNRLFLLPLAACAIFFAIFFVNSFLEVKQRYPRIFLFSTLAAVLTVVYGILLAFKITLVPAWLSGNLMHALLLSGAIYFLGISLFSYFQRRKEARFLALSIVALIAGLIAYLLYTYGVLAYHPLLIHAVEAGALLEGVLLSLALAERVRLANKQKEQAEAAALNAQKYFSRHLMQAQEAERERFSSAMHDSIGHGMLVLKQSLDKILISLGSNNSDSVHTGLDAEAAAAVRQSLSEQIEYSHEILNDVRDLSHDLHPHLLHRLGLTAALESTLERAFSGMDIDWHAEIDKLPVSLPDDVQITAYRVAQEAINNIIKHAQASEVIFIARMEDQRLVVCIKDDGKGFHIEQQRENGLGLSGMKERVRLFGGGFEITSGIDMGTEINFSIPAIAVDTQGNMNGNN